MTLLAPSSVLRGFAGLVIAVTAGQVLADDAFFEVPLKSIKATEGELPKNPGPESITSFSLANTKYLKPYVVLNGEGEAYLASSAAWDSLWRVDNESLHLKTAGGKDVTGTLFLPNEKLDGLVTVKFLVPASSADSAKKSAFFEAKEKHYQRLMQAQLPGSPWFRYQARDAQAALAGKSLAEFEADTRRPLNDGRSETHFEDTFQVLSGGRAVSENLQLDRLLPLTAPEEPTVDVNSLEGITVAEMDWEPLVKDLPAPADALAPMLPSDQYALLFPSFQAMVRMMDEAALNGTPLLDTVQPRSESARSRERYEKQLCLSINDLSRLLGDQLVGEVAFTGSDPYLRTGTDVAILFDPKNAAMLMAHIASQQTLAAKADPEIKTSAGTEGGVKYSAVVSPDRTVCSYLAQIDKIVMVTNSLAQLKRIAETAAKPSESLAALPEFRFFRNRYKSGPDETGLLVVTDRTIRRWCSPKWRIATSRRTRAAAIMSHYQAESLRELAEGKVEPHDIKTILQVPDLGTLRLTKRGVTSSTYGTLEFQTPIVELDLTKVTKTEAETYERWRSGYQQNFSRFFDPIAVSFSVRDNKLSADLTVMPLIDASDYRDFVELVSGVELKPASGDPHAGSLLHWAMALNIQSERLKWASNFLEGPTGSSLLGWLGQSISIYADPDPFWSDLAAAMNNRESNASKAEEAGNKFMQENFHRLPVAFTAEVSNALKLTLFLSGVRAYIEQTAPGMLNWTALEHNGQSYVKITAKPAARDAAPFAQKLAILYAATPEMFVLTLNEDLLKRALDRQAARKKEQEGKKEADAKTNEVKADSTASPPNRRWLGKSMALQIDRKIFEMFESVFGRTELVQYMQARAWSNIPILNEWKRLYPDRDPVAFHQQYWETALICPGGGNYVWNEKFQTMESTVYGHPGEPKAGQSVPLPLSTAQALDFGVTFENRGLRARVELLRSPVSK